MLHSGRLQPYLQTRLERLVRDKQLINYGPRSFVTFGPGVSQTFIRQQIAWNKSSLLLKNTLQNTQTLQLFAMNIKTESIYKSYLKCQAGRIRLSCLIKRDRKHKYFKLKRGARKLTGENLEVVWAEFSTLS
jgi:hypothetical protein